jgi:hypothetical protein
LKWFLEMGIHQAAFDATSVRHEPGSPAGAPTSVLGRENVPQTGTIPRPEAFWARCRT